jgi:hypothetical protein
LSFSFILLLTASAIIGFARCQRFSGVMVW